MKAAKRHHFNCERAVDIVLHTVERTWRPRDIDLRVQLELSLDIQAKKLVGPTRMRGELSYCRNDPSICTEQVKISLWSRPLPTRLGSRTSVCRYMLKYKINASDNWWTAYRARPGSITLVECVVDPVEYRHFYGMNDQKQVNRTGALEQKRGTLMASGLLHA